MNKISIKPYSHFDGIPTMRDSEIVAFYDKLVADGTAKIMFCDGTIPAPQNFLKVVKDPGTIFIVAYDGEKPAGISWINRIEYQHHRAWIHFALFSSHWGKGSTEIGVAMADYLLSLKRDENFAFEYFIGICPSSNQAAINYMAECGGMIVGQIPTWDNNLKSCKPGTLIYYRRKT
jgi:RimJ/RimL family protein N-acetyltransferase